MLTFWSICVLQSGPQHLPKNNILFGFTLLLNLLLSAALNRAVMSVQRQVAPGVSQDPSLYTQSDFMTQFSMVVAATVIFSALVYLVLRIFNYQSRVYLTLFAFFGTTVVFNAMLLIIHAIFGRGIGLMVWLGSFIGITIWSLVVSGQIIAQAMETTRLRGILTYIGIAIAMAVIQMLIFGTPPGLAIPEASPSV